MALNIVRVRRFWTSNIFVIIVFRYTQDTGAVTGTEQRVELYILALIEIHIAAFQPFNTALFKTNFNSMFFLNFIIGNRLYLGQIKNMCVSGYPTLPVKNGPTLTMFLTSGKKNVFGPKSPVTRVRNVPLPRMLASMNCTHWHLIRN